MLYRASSPDYPVDKWAINPMPKQLHEYFESYWREVEKLQDMGVEQALKEGFNSAYEFNVLDKPSKTRPRQIRLER